MKKGFYRLVPYILVVTIVGTLDLIHFSPLVGAQIAVSFSTIQKGHYSGVREPLKIVIRDRDEWIALWERHSAVQADPSPPPPAIDFSVEMVAGIFLGEKTTGGYAVEITRAERDESDLRFYYREKTPAQHAIVTQALTQPYHLVRLPKYGGSAMFLREDR